jgi:biopolymer transport protein ExbD
VKPRKQEDVEIPITPMLDMAFQLLTFFILTYHPAPTEGQFSMNLLPAQPAVAMDAPAADAPASNNDLPAGLKTLPVTLRSGGEGTLGQVTLGENQIDGMEAFTKELTAILKDPTLPFDQTVIKVDRNLKYAELVKVINVFTEIKGADGKPRVTNISFAELGTDEGAAP